MKKIILMTLTICMTAVLAACGTQEPEEQETQAVTETQETAEPEETEEAEVETEASDASNTLVVYFSNTGNTKNIAEIIASGLAADIYEIVAEEPYSAADLDYGNDNSRSTLEMNDPTVRPAISGTVENMDQYTTVYIGYPIWWGEAPRIVDTFVESYDFTGKTVIPFCTSASSGTGSSAQILAELAGAGEWTDGQRFSGNEDSTEVMAWVNSL